MNLLIITRRIDQHDDRMGYFSGWLNALSKQTEHIYVLPWQESDNSNLPNNVEIFNPPKGKIRKIVWFQKKLIKFLPKVDGVYCHQNPEYTIIAAPLAKLFRKKIVSWYAHGAVNIRRYIMEIFANVLLTSSDKGFRNPSFPKKLKIIGQGIDTDLFSFIERKELNMPLGLLTIGRISPTKDIESMIKAVYLLGKEDIKVTLSIVGEAALSSDIQYKESLKQMVAKMNLENSIKFLSGKFHNELPALYRGADIFINLSHTGSMDKVVLEAMAAGCFVLTANEAFEGFIDSRWMVEKDNPQDVADKIKRTQSLSSDEQMRETRRLRTIVEEQHDLKKLADKIIQSFTK